MDSIQKNETFELDSLKCLRTEYFLNECDLCFSRCNFDALGLLNEKIKLFDKKCTQCADCVGVCPTHALKINSFDINNFIYNFINSNKNIIKERDDIPSFGMLNCTYLIILVINKPKLILEYDKEKNNFFYLQNIYKQTKNILEYFNYNFYIEFKKIDRKKDFKNFVNKNLFKSILKNKQKSFILNQIKPQIEDLLIKNLKKVSKGYEKTKLNIENSTLFFNKTIDKNRCTNCLDCVNLCPTNAIFQNSNKNEIVFNSFNCVGCHICNDICKEKALHNSDYIQIEDYINKKNKTLIKFFYK